MRATVSGEILGLRLSLPMPAEQFPVPTKKGFRLNNAYGKSPEFCKSRQNNKQQTIAVCQLRAFDLSIQEDDLLAQECVLQDQIVSAARKISEKTGNQCGPGRFYPMSDTLLKPMKILLIVPLPAPFLIKVGHHNTGFYRDG
jgi:hypothetical protein